MTREVTDFPVPCHIIVAEAAGVIAYADHSRQIERTGKLRLLDAPQ